MFRKLYVDDEHEDNKEQSDQLKNQGLKEKRRQGCPAETAQLILGGINVKPTIESLQVQIHKLEQRDPVMNKNIINKLKRKVRALENNK